MRIIGGLHKGLILHPPKNLPVRPTTDKAKESLFNILDNQFSWNQIHVLDLFSGTGNMVLEFCSRGAAKAIAVDADVNCVKFVKEMGLKLNFAQLEVHKKDAFTYLKTCTQHFNIIFADAPYRLNGIANIPDLVFDRNLLMDDGWLILEHQSHLDLSRQKGFFELRKYGQSAFSFFRLAQ